MSTITRFRATAIVIASLAIVLWAAWATLGGAPAEQAHVLAGEDYIIFCRPLLGG
jgi:hypothetical protein